MRPERIPDLNLPDTTRATFSQHIKGALPSEDEPGARTNRSALVVRMVGGVS